MYPFRAMPGQRRIGHHSDKCCKKKEREEKKLNVQHQQTNTKQTYGHFKNNWIKYPKEPLANSIRCGESNRVNDRKKAANTESVYCGFTMAMDVLTLRARLAISCQYVRQWKRRRRSELVRALREKELHINIRYTNNVMVFFPFSSFEKCSIEI